MDMNGIGATIESTRPAAPATAAPTDPRLWKAAQDFQEIFMSQFVRMMRSTSQQSDLVEPAPGREVFDEMFSEALGRQMAQERALGLQDVIYRQMGGAYGPLDKPGAQTGRK